MLRPRDRNQAVRCFSGTPRESPGASQRPFPDEGHSLRGTGSDCAPTTELPRGAPTATVDTADSYAAASAIAPTSGGSDLDSAGSDPPFFALNQADCVPLWEGPRTSLSYSSSKSSGLSGLVPPLLLQRVRRLSPRLSPRAPSGSSSSHPSRLPRPRSGSYRSLGNGPLSHAPSGPMSLLSSGQLSARSTRSVPAPSSFGGEVGPSSIIMDSCTSTFSHGGGRGGAVLVTPRSSAPSSLSSNASSGLFKVGPRHMWLPAAASGGPSGAVTAAEEARAFAAPGPRRSKRASPLARPLPAPLAHLNPPQSAACSSGAHA